MTNGTADRREAFIIPSRALHGTRQKMLDDIDQAIVGLLALRHLIDDASPAPAGLARTNGSRIRRSRWPRLHSALGAVGLWRLE